jgi:tetratricopeptide (TPR) repeat protein
MRSPSSLIGLIGVLTAVTLSAIVVAATHNTPSDAPPLPVEPPPSAVEPQAMAVPPSASDGVKSWVTERVVDGPPLSLTASDGSGLTLASLRANAVVEGFLAFTEMHLAFDNPENRVREGTFKIVLPEGASVARLAMKIDGVWQEGEVVQKQRARVAYEDALHRKQDPALMELGAANEVTARVFPIPAHGRKEIIVSYAQELTGGARYALPLRGLPQLGMLDVSVGGLGPSPQTLHRERFIPTEDFVADGPAPSITALRSGDLVVARVRPVPEAMPDPVTNAVVLVDTSASRALGLESELHALKGMLQELATRQTTPVTVTVAAFDQEIVRVYQGDARGFGDAEVATILERRALGASDIEHALAWARDEAKTSGATRVVLVTDGVATAGEQDGAKLALAAAALKDGGAARLDVVAVGGIRDDALAHKLVAAGLAHDGVVADASEGIAAVARRLESGTRSDVAVAVEGATWSYPTHLDGVQPGDEVLVYAELPEASKVHLHVGGAAAFDVEPSKGAPPLIERAWAQAKVASLESEERDHGKSADLERRIVELSVKHRVLSEYTALLVLEGDADYARFDIDRRALTDILTVDDGRLALLQRAGAAGNNRLAKEKNDERDTTALDKKVASAKPEPNDTLVPLVPRSAGPAGGGDGVAGALADEAVARLAAPSASAAPTEQAQGGTGTRARGEEGSMGNPSTVATMPVAAAAPASAPAAPLLRGDIPAVDLSAAAAAQGESLQMGTLGALGGIGASSGAGFGGGGSVGHAASGRSVGQLGAGSQDEERGVDPYTGKMRMVKARLAARDASGAFAIASTWEATSPGDVLALVALGETAEATKDFSTASRAYGSIIDLFPARADLRRFAGERLEHLQGSAALALAIDTFDKARRDRPDHPESHRLAAYARVRRGEYAAAFDILEAGAARHYPEGRFRGVDRILREDLGLVAAAWMKAEPARKSEILARLSKAGGAIENAPSIRFVLNWETDANDVDFHIEDGLGGHAYYASPHLPSGGDLYADVTTGYGPECFTVREPHGKRATPYKLRAHYFSRGPMGYGMGKLEIIDHDGRGGLKFEERPFIVMADHAFVDLGTVRE